MCLSDEVAKCITNFYAVFCGGIDHVFEVRLDPPYRKRLIIIGFDNHFLASFYEMNLYLVCMNFQTFQSDSSTLLCLEKIYLVFENSKVLLGKKQ